MLKGTAASLLSRVRLRATQRRCFSSKGSARAETETASKLKPFQAPPTYKEQVSSGVPLGKRRFYGNEREFAWQISFGKLMFFCEARNVRLFPV